MHKKLFWLLFTAITILAVFTRLYKVTEFPPSPYWEEAALGYDAYSILKTGKDHHGHPFPVVAFESFGDWKPALYFYAIIPFIELVGLNTLAVRLPAIVSGVAIVLGMGVLARLFAPDKKRADLVQLITMAVTAVSPWAIEFSRAGWEVNLATALVLWGVVLFLIALQKKTKQIGWLVGSVVLLVLSMYTYHATRIIAPLLGVSLALLWLYQKKSKALVSLVLSGVLALALVAPLLIAARSNQTTQRFAETSIFSDVSVIQESNLRKERAGNTWWAALIYHRYVLFGEEILTNALSHFDINFLFISGDSNPRHSVQYVGQLYHIELIFLFVGMIYVFSHWKAKYGLLFVWLLVGLFPAALTKATPHALRILPTLPVFMLLISLGIYALIQWSPKRIGALIAVLYLGEFVLFWRFYSTVYPKLYGDQWQYGYEQLMHTIAQQQQAHPDEPVYITREQGRPAMYYFFYTQMDPRRVQLADQSVKHDQGEFLEFEHMHFINSVSEVTDHDALIASSPEQKDQLEKIVTNNQPGSGVQIVQTINDAKGNPVWVVYQLHGVSTL